MTTVLLVLVGGAVGAVLRYGVSLRLGASRLPRATLLVNAVGSLLLGATTAAVARGGLPDGFTPLVATGFCGAFTTFSTFALETVRMLEGGARRDAALYCALSVVVAVSACLAGYAAVALGLS